MWLREEVEEFNPSRVWDREPDNHALNRGWRKCEEVAWICWVLQDFARLAKGLDEPPLAFVGPVWTLAVVYNWRVHRAIRKHWALRGILNLGEPKLLIFV